MKRRERGITTSTVMIYVIALLFVISALSVISTYFEKEIKATLVKNQDARTYTTFMSYFTQDIQENDNKVEIADTSTQQENGIDYETYYITFSNGNQYIYYTKTNSIYKNTIKICENVEYCRFFTNTTENKKTEIKIEFKAGEFDKTGKNALLFYM